MLLVRFALPASKLAQKKVFCGLVSPETGVAFLEKGNSSICLTVLPLELNVLTLLCLTFWNPKIQIFSTLLAEKGTHLIAQNAIVFRDMYLQCPARNNNG